jgi:hypothetical protein
VLSTGGSSNEFITVGTCMLPIAGHQFSLNAPSSAGVSVTFVTLHGKNADITGTVIGLF